MKKTVGITIIAAAFAVSSAFAKKASASGVRIWVLYAGAYVTMTAAEVKALYCAGANLHICAYDTDDAYSIIYKP